MRQAAPINTANRSWYKSLKVGSNWVIGVRVM